jgi:hypothetical protein
MGYEGYDPTLRMCRRVCNSSLGLANARQVLPLSYIPTHLIFLHAHPNDNKVQNKGGIN